MQTVQRIETVGVEPILPKANVFFGDDKPVVNADGGGSSKAAFRKFKAENFGNLKAAAFPAWEIGDFISNGEQVHLEIPGTGQYENLGALSLVYSIVGANQYGFYMPNTPRSGIKANEALDMVTAIIKSNGGYVSKSSQSNLNGNTIIDIEGGAPENLLFLKGRIIITPKNVFYLETLSPDNNNLHSDFVKKFKI